MSKNTQFKLLLGNFLRRKRMEKDKTIEELAEYAGLDPDHLGKLERGESSPGAVTLSKLRKAINIDINYALDQIEKELENISDNDNEKE